MGMRRRLRALGGFLRRDRPRASGEPEWDDVERSFRHIWHRLIDVSEERYRLNRRRPNALVLQMGKVASFSIRAALCERGINAFHSHGLSPMQQQGALSICWAGRLRSASPRTTCAGMSRMSRCIRWCAGTNATSATKGTS